ncbi:MAG: two-component system chemotaxis sensor kinase CheA [Oleiphilaceae bacterium]|jgi:two-component system chemotaxis sensor kinase CheA
MDSMLETFLQESRDNIEAASTCFLQLEKSPGDTEIMNDLFRSIHTMKGSSGLFDIVPFTRVVHAAEDVLDVVREGGLYLTPEHVDLFLDSLDQVNTWIDDLEKTGELSETAEGRGQILALQLRALLGSNDATNEMGESEGTIESVDEKEIVNKVPAWISKIDDAARLECFSNADDDVLALIYTPNDDCFFNADDPIHTIQGLSGLKWFSIQNNNNWDDAEKIDPFHCNLKFYCLLNAEEMQARNDLKYIADQVDFIKLQPFQLIIPEGDFGDGIAYETLLEDATKFIEQGEYDALKRSIKPLLEIGNADLLQTSALAWMAVLLNHANPSETWLKALLSTIESGDFNAPENKSLGSEEEDTNVDVPSTKITSIATPPNVVASSDIPASTKNVLETQLRILNMPSTGHNINGRVLSTVSLLNKLFNQLGWQGLVPKLEQAGEKSMVELSCEPLAQCLQQCITGDISAQQYSGKKEEDIHTEITSLKVTKETSTETQELAKEDEKIESCTEQFLPERRAGTRYASEESATSKIEGNITSKGSAKFLRVDQERIDMLMDLVGELVVAKNALPFLARRANNEFKVKTLGKEIKSQYEIINRLSEELQNAMMAVRMVPVSSVFQRFPRLVRDLSRRLEKNIELVMEGEETEADKNVIEKLADPLIHLVRNSLDHGIEMPADRVAAGKPEKGTLTLRATSQDDHVVIEVIDDGKGIDPMVIKKKAYEKGVIDETQLDSISDQEAIELIFAAGLSSKDQSSDLSGRGVGMDVVRTTVNEAGGSVSLTSELNVGSTLRLSLPLSMAVAQVMMIEVDKQLYGISMTIISETVRVPVESIERIKDNEAIVLRDKLIPLRRLRDLLGLTKAEQSLKEEAILIVTIYGEEIGLIIDDFHEGIDVIQKPLEGVMSSYPIYAGATLLGDGRVLLILDIKELL